MVDSVDSNYKPVHYTLCAVNRRGNLVIKDLKSSHYFIRPAHEVVTSKQLLQGFSSQQVAQIKALAEKPE